MEVLAFVLYFVVVLAIGVFFFIRSKDNNQEDYFLGGRAMGPWVTALSAQASDMSAWLLMGLPGSIIAFGLLCGKKGEYKKNYKKIQSKINRSSCYYGFKRIFCGFSRSYA